VIYGTIWIAAIVGIFATLKRKKEQLKMVDLPNDLTLETK